MIEGVVVEELARVGEAAPIPVKMIFRSWMVSISIKEGVTASIVVVNSSFSTSNNDACNLAQD